MHRTSGIVPRRVPLLSRSASNVSTASLRRARGFTLLEVLVVLVIGGLLVGLASLSLTRNPRTDLIEQANRLALTFETAGDEAQLRATAIEWQPVAGGYRFVARQNGGWRQLDDELLRPTRWSEPLSAVIIRYPGANGRERSASALGFTTESVSSPATVTLVSAAGSVSVVTDGSGRFDVLNGAP